MGSYLPATFVSRPNRFIVVARLADGRRVRAHLADPGRLRELLLPGAPLRLRPAGRRAGRGGGKAASRKTRFTVALVRSPDPPRAWVSVETAGANRLAAGLFDSGAIRGVGRPARVAREVRLGGSRFDFLLSRADGSEILAEVKAVSLVENGVGLFPDAPTARGARHVREIEEHVRGGGKGLVLFVVQREDARIVRPNAATDPAFAAALRSAARSGVLLRGARFRMGEDGEAEYAGPVRVLPAPVGERALRGSRRAARSSP